MTSEYPPSGPGAGAGVVGPVYVVAFLLLQIGLAAGVVFALFNTVPAMPLQGVESAADTTANHEKALIQIMALAGSLGGLLHGLRSYVWYVGNRDLRWSWLPTYLSLPITGALISIVFYLVIRAGFVGLGGQSVPNYLGFAGAGALIGLFQAPAILKLKAVAETLFTKPEPGSDARPQQEDDAPDKPASDAVPKLADSPVGLSPTPVIVGAKVAAANGAYELRVNGSGFRPVSELYADDSKLTITARSPRELVAQVATRPTAVRVVTPPPGGGRTSSVPVQEADA